MAIQGALDYLKTELEKEKRMVLSFEEYLRLLRNDPERVLRNIFQLFHDMVQEYVTGGEDEYSGDPESIGFVKYDCSRIFIEGADEPFFPDRLFANRFVRQVKSLRYGSQQNQLHAYIGPPGCGKSRFLNNLIGAFERYTATEQGRSFEIFWDLDANPLTAKSAKEERPLQQSQKIEVPCPSHDCPILLVPKDYRFAFLKKLLADSDEEVKKKIFGEKGYKWLFKGEACTICSSLFWALFDTYRSLDKVLAHVKVRPYVFDRRRGEGISIFNPGDSSKDEAYFTNEEIQAALDRLFGPNKITYVFSPLSRTNNGIYVLMDIKDNNKTRLLELHNVITEGVHKVSGVIEENINSLFFALMNPEDKAVLDDQKGVQSIHGRISYNTIGYVLEVQTEMKIYESVFGENVRSRFLPHVLENFCRIVIASRMSAEQPALKEWIKDLGSKYKRYCDEEGRLLRMELYSGVIPPWLSEEDKRNFTAPIRRKLITEAEKEGLDPKTGERRGLTGRDSIQLFGEFLSRYGSRESLINMGNVLEYFKHGIRREQRDAQIPQNFLASLENWYDYSVLNEVKESLYFYNKEQIQEDILHYLWAINHDIGTKTRCPYTGKEIEVTSEFLRLIGSYFLGKSLSDSDAKMVALAYQKRYVQFVSKDPKQDITKTDFYEELFRSYVANLKRNALQPFARNENFREAIKLFGTKEFDVFDERMKEYIRHMIRNLVENFGYTEQGAKEICLYVLDKNLMERF